MLIASTKCHFCLSTQNVRELILQICDQQQTLVSGITSLTPELVHELLFFAESFQQLADILHPMKMWFTKRHLFAQKAFKGHKLHPERA